MNESSNHPIPADQQGARNAMREPRLRRLVKIEVRLADGRQAEALVRNISSYGLCAKFPLTVERGDSILVCKDGYGQVAGVVRWVDRDLFGAQFDDPIDVDRFNFGAQNSKGHFVKKVDNGHVWKGFQQATDIKRPGFRSR